MKALSEIKQIRKQIIKKRSIKIISFNKLEVN